MKTSSKNTNKFLAEVKELLDNANWNFEACEPNSNYDDVEKALDYLNTQKFSIQKIREQLADVWEDYRYNVKNDDITSHDECVELAAKMIADRLAFDRITPYIWQTYKPGVDNGKKWFINETVSFKIN